ncbi:MAG: VOC family protein, partial [Myxococcota bacterium]
MPDLKAFELAHVALQCAELDTMQTFYCDVLGYAVVWRPDPDNCYLSRGRDSLALHVGPTSRETRLDHFGFTLPDAASVDAWAKHIVSQGIALDQPPKTHR